MTSVTLTDGPSNIIIEEELDLLQTNSIPSMGAFHRILFSPLLILLHVTLVVHATRVSLKINIGGGQVGGFLAESDVLEVEKSMPRTQYRGNIDSETEDSDVFRTQRFTRHEDLVLHVPVADGIYDVTLLFAETWKGSFQEDARVFYVSCIISSSLKLI